jgi:Na+-driven multidrug efflux pump
MVFRAAGVAHQPMSIAKHTTYNVAGALIPTAVMLVTVPLYLKVIGIERYGVLALCWLMLGYVNFLNLGLGPALSQSLAAKRNQKKFSASDIFWTALWLNLLMGLIAAAIIYALSGVYFDTMAKLSAGSRQELEDALPIFACIIPVVMLNSVLAGALQGRERFLVTNSISVMTSTLMAIIPLTIALVYSPALNWLIAGAVLARLLSVMFLFRSCIEAVPVTRPNGPSKELVKSLLSFGGWITVGGDTPGAVGRAVSALCRRR